MAKPTTADLISITFSVSALSANLAALHQLNDLLDSIGGALAAINEGTNTMPTREELDAALEQLGVAVSDAANRVVARINDLQTQLAAALANGQPPPDFTNELAQIATDVSAIGNIAPDAPTP